MSLTVAAIQALGIHLISANNLNVPLRELVFAHISKLISKLPITKENQCLLIKCVLQTHYKHSTVSKWSVI